VIIRTVKSRGRKREAAIYNDACKICGVCCQGRTECGWDPSPPVRPEETEMILERLEESPDGFGKFFNRKPDGVVRLAYTDEGDCVFFEQEANGTTRCKIHDFKPRFCADYSCALLGQEQDPDSFRHLVQLARTGAVSVQEFTETSNCADKLAELTHG